MGLHQLLALLAFILAVVGAIMTWVGREREGQALVAAAVVLLSMIHLFGASLG